ncbi:MAG: type II secretion system protein GspG [Candidatus Sumerlaeota bacterium]|nr:type II secretion system protein GspG [Candidatus Sumerlaeota bacterium]
MEAQTRSKVSRTKTDMRSMSTALETYRVDSGKYPPDYQYYSIVTTRDLNAYLPRLIVLTTPIAYMSAIPEDVFAEGAMSRNATLASPYKVAGRFVRPFCFDYAYRYLPDGRDENALYPGLWTLRISRSPGVMWALRSIGPDLYATVLGDLSPSATSYDPTNGTISAGDIFFLGPGIGPESGSVR